ADAQGGIELPTGTSVLRVGQVAIVVARRAQLAAAVAFLSEQPALQGDSASLLPALRRIDFLATLDEADLQELARGVRTVRLRAGETVFNKGDPGDYFYLVLSGAVGLYVEEGRVHETVQPGGFFGEISLLTGEPRSATARASSDCELGAIARDEFRAVAMRTPAVALEMTRVLGQRLASMARTQPAPEKPRRFFGR
ncbi:MAG: Crp/Fnr family transcriptional regulator, partial [Myxococcales bacterium]